MARIVRVDPRDSTEVTEVDLPDLLARQWGMPVGYVIAAYNDMARARDAGDGSGVRVDPTRNVDGQHRCAGGRTRPWRFPFLLTLESLIARRQE